MKSLTRPGCFLITAILCFIPLCSANAQTPLAYNYGGLNGDYGNVVDAVLLWWRDEDGDLVDALVDALTDLADGGVIWLLTPKVGRPGEVEAADITEAAPIAGLAVTTTMSIRPDWTATRLAAPKNHPR